MTWEGATTGGVASEWREKEPGLAHAHEHVLGESELVAHQRLELPSHEVAVADVDMIELQDGEIVEVASSGVGLGGA